LRGSLKLSERHSFRNDRPEDYLAGFPWHPHRGIETITYVLAGTVEHGDSLGHQGAIAAGDVQWMTAGRGIIHQEMPQGDPDGRMHGFQLWANLPSALKMTAPRYQEVTAGDIPCTAPGSLDSVSASTENVCRPDRRADFGGYQDMASLEISRPGPNVRAGFQTVHGQAAFRAASARACAGVRCPSRSISHARL
jgi:redox-sensitive bicupin YhaK (pirin superfamily)